MSEKPESPSELGNDKLADLINDIGLPDDMAAAPDEEPEEEQEEAEAPDSEEETEEAAAGEDEESESDGEEAAEEAETEEESEASEADVLKAQLDALDKKAKHFESVAGNNAGRLGYVQRKYDELKQQYDQVVARVQQEVGEAGYQPQPPPPMAQPQQQPTQDREAMIRYASEAAGNEFVFQHPDVLIEVDGQRQVDPEFAKAVQAATEAVGQVQFSDDPEYVRKHATLVLETGYRQLDAARAAKAAADIGRRQGDQAEALKAKKRAVSPPRSGKKTPPKQKPKTLADLSKKDVARIIDSRAGLE